jgi:hypothetical protein
MIRNIEILFCILLPIAVLASEGETVQTDVLFTYNGVDFTNKDVTFISFAEAAKCINNIAATYDSKIHKVPVNFYPPSTSIWKTAKDDDLWEYYRHGLSGVIELFVYSQILVELRKKSMVDISSYYSEHSIPKYVCAAAKASQEVMDACIAASENKSIDSNSFAGLVKSRCAVKWDDHRLWDGLCAESLSARPYRLVNKYCFSYLNDGCVAPWFRWYIDSGLISCHISAAIRKDKQKYIDLLEARFGSYNYLAIENVQAKDRDSVLQLVKTICDKDGNIAVAGIELANNTLRELGSPSKIVLSCEPIQIIQKRWQVDTSKILFRQLIDVNRTNADNLRSFIYITQDKPKPHFDSYSETPGNFLYDCGKEAILHPICVEILSKLKVRDDVKLRKIEDLMYWSTAVTLAPEVNSYPMPSLKHE